MRHFCYRKHYKQDNESPRDFEKRIGEELKNLGDYLFELDINNGIYASFGAPGDPDDVYTAPFVIGRIEFCASDIPMEKRAEKLLQIKLGLTRMGYSYPV